MISWSKIVLLEMKTFTLESTCLYCEPKNCCWSLFKDSNTWSFYNVVRMAYRQWCQFRVKMIDSKSENPVYLYRIASHFRKHQFVKRHDYCFSKTSTTFQGNFLPLLFPKHFSVQIFIEFFLLLVYCAMNNGNEEDKEIAKHCHTGNPLTFVIEFEKKFPEDEFSELPNEPEIASNVRFIPSSSVESLLWRTNKEPISLPYQQNSDIIEYINNCW